MLPSFYIARGCYRFPQRGWANFWCISILFGRTVNSNMLFVSRLNHPLSKPRSAVPGIENCISVLVYAFKEKSCPGKVGHPPNQVNFSEPLQEKKKKWPLFKSQYSRACSFVQISAHACSNYLAFTKLRWAKVFLWRNVGQVRRMTPSSKKGDPTSTARLDPYSYSRANFCLSS